MEPVPAFRLEIYFWSVQKMCLECASAGTDVPKSEAQPQANLLVIAAPRPFGMPDLDLIQAGLTKGRFFVLTILIPRKIFGKENLTLVRQMVYAYRLFLKEDGSCLGLF
jgi:hypothetical protein